MDLLTSILLLAWAPNDTREMKGKTGSLQKAAWLKVGIRKASDQAVDDGSSSEFNCKMSLARPNCDISPYRRRPTSSI